ncbi:MAG: phosphohistidine phosphatase [Blastocatellia bacterium]|nr:phosphohistidine phosphatase [Blastocatellia bacterium]
MKTLLLLRHAKSSKDDPSLIDFDRPLNERGKNDAQLIGKYIRQQRIKADFVVSSPAERARQTAG